MSEQINPNLPNYENTAIIVITYNPESDFKKNYEQYNKIVRNCIIVDNGSHNAKEIENLTLGDKRNYFIELHENKGIAYALNIGIRKAQYLNKKWILTLDDDSFPYNEIIDVYSNIIKLNPNIGILGTDYSELNHQSELKIKDTLTVITSGALQNIQIFNDVGYYNEKLFIDCVDFDMNIRVKEYSPYRVCQINKALISHHLGSPIKKHGICSSNHNEKRRYYWARNTIYLNKRYFLKVPLWIIKKDYFFIRDLISMILIERNKTQKFNAIMKGIINGIKGK